MMGQCSEFAFQPTPAFHKTGKHVKKQTSKQQQQQQQQQQP